MIVMVDGGFCSQLVKYAFGEFLKKTLGVLVKYDVSWFEANGMDCDGKNKRELQIQKVFPNIDFKIATEDEIKKAKENNYFTNPNPYKFCSDVLALRTPAYIDGYYENIVYLNYIKDELYSNLDFSKLPINDQNQAILKEIENCDYSCAVHVRRGDFVNLGLAFLTPNYYVNAIREIQERAGKPVHFFFFSNDMNYVKENVISLCPDINYTIVDINNNDTGYLDLYLISKCNAQIASNSSFGFWGSFLNQNVNSLFVFPSEWIPSKDEVGFYAPIAHYLPNSIILNQDGTLVPYNTTDDTVDQAIKSFYESNENYLIEYDNTKKDKICAIYFSSNGIFYPKDLKTFEETLVHKNRFEWYKTRYETAQKHIFVRDVNMCWYQYGISSNLNDMDKVADFLKQETEGYKVICIGSSAGAYAALAFACLLKAEKCFISSPCLNVKESILLNQKYIRLSEYNGNKYQNYIEHPEKYNDILPLVQTAQTKVYYICPMFSDIDIPEYEKVKNISNVKVLRYASDVHGQPFSNALIRMLLNNSNLDDIFGKVYFSENQIMAHLSKKQQINYIFNLANPKKKWNWFVKKKFWKNFVKLYCDLCKERDKK